MRSSSAPSGVTWRAAAPKTIGLREWGDEFVVYCGARAATHVLSPLAGTLLLELRESAEALSADVLAARLVGDEARIADADASEPPLAAAVQASLLEFERMGLASQTET